jgi:hypothetical protein
MAMSAFVRGGVAAALAFAAVGAVVLYAERDGPESSPVAGPGPASPRQAGELAAPGSQNGGIADPVESVRQERFPGDAQADVFAAVQPRSERAPDRAPAVAPKPPVPPFPYKYAGRLEDHGGTIAVYLQKGNELISIRKGDVLEGAWKIEAVGDDRIEVAFLPGGQQLSMLLASLTGETATSKADASSSPASSAAAQSAPSAGPLVGGTVPAAAAPASPRARLAAVARAAALPAQASPAGPETASALPTGKLGLEAPTSGSMPTGPAPTGKLGH